MATTLQYLATLRLDIVNRGGKSLIFLTPHEQNSWLCYCFRMFNIYVCNFSVNTNFFLAFALTWWVHDNEWLLLLPGSHFCDALTFGMCLYLLKSDMIAGGCYIFSLSNSFRMFRHETGSWTNVTWKYMLLIEREYFHLFKTNHNVGLSTLNEIHGKSWSGY